MNIFHSISGGGVVRRMMQFLLGMALVAGTAGPVFAQDKSGRITGRVVSSTGEPLSYVQIDVDGQSVGSMTDLDGRYFIPRVTAGPVSVIAQLIGYARKTVTHVVVAPGGAAVLDIIMAEEAVALEGITVTAAVERGSAASLLDQRQSAVAVIDAIGSTDIARSPDSDAADVARRLVGTTVSDGKYVFVRGLGERYSQTSLNGSPMPSPEPEREVVPLDLFSSGFLESITTQKTYTPDLPGDFSGGSVAIQTRDFPDYLTVRFGMSSSINTESQFRDGYLSYNGGGLDFLGIDDGARELPREFDRILGGLRGNISIRELAPNQKTELGRALQRQFTPVAGSTPANRSFDFTIGNQIGVLGKQFGFLTGVNYSDTYTRRVDEVERKFTTTSFDPAVPIEYREPNVEYTFDRGSRNTSIGVLTNLTFLPSPTHKVGLKTTYNRNADDEARNYSGTNNEDLSSDVRSNRLRYVSRSMGWAQLFGEHQILGQSRFNWRVVRARATRYEPALREAIYTRGFGEPSDGPFYLETVAESGRYFFSDLVDDDLSAGADLRVSFTVAGQTGALKIGGEYRKRDRDFFARRFNWSFARRSIANIDDVLSNEAAIVGGQPRGEQVVLDEVVEPGDQYIVDESRHAGFIMLDLPLGDRFNGVVGARYEQYNLRLASRSVTKASLNQGTLLPAVNVTFRATSAMNIRAAFSQTLDRPEFRELAPFQFTEAASLRQVVGNPQLDVARFRNYDLRWEWFPGPGEVVSLGGFYKQIENPIEQVFFAAASSAYSFQNAVDGSIMGIELEARKGLGFLSESLRNVTAQANVALIDSEVNVIAEGAFVPTNLKRPLEGQSPYVVNLGAYYTQPQGLTEVGLFYNVYGKRISAAGGSGLPDIFEQPRNQLDVTFRQRIFGGARFKLNITNLLHADMKYEQSANGITLVQREYRQGRSISFGLSF